jgi:elongation factor P--beta-lysine ligase
MDMDALDWMAVDENIKSIMKPVQEFLQQVLDTSFFKEVAEQKAVHTSSLIL